MAFSPKFLVLGAVLVSLVLAVVMLSAPGAQTGSVAAGQKATEAASAGSEGGGNVPMSAASQTQGKSSVLASVTLDLILTAKQDNIGETDNVRWSLVRGTDAAAGLYDAKRGVDWSALRKVSASGTIQLPAGASWSFNDAYGGGAGYKIASGVLAGGQCSLATAYRAAAMKAGLVNKATPHRRPIPGFPQNETANIWWGTYDLLIQNPTEREISMVWKLAPDSVVITIQ